MFNIVKNKQEFLNTTLESIFNEISQTLMIGKFDDIKTLLERYNIELFDNQKGMYKTTYEILSEISEKLSFNAEKVKNDIVQWIRGWFAENGPDCNAVIGISGGKDSSVVAALCVEALGKERVVGVMMPDGKQSDIDDAFKVCEHLNILHTVVNIGKTTDILRQSILDGLVGQDGFSYCGINFSKQANINLPPRIRMTTLYAVSQSINGRVACTDNLSESYIGYSTRWGDNVGDFCPLANLTSEEVVAVGDALGLPYELTHKVPSDGLCGQTDEDRFGFTYEVLNKYIRTGICENKETQKKIDEMHKRNLFKSEPIPKFPYPNKI